jgi:hypothetical protein
LSERLIRALHDAGLFDSGGSAVPPNRGGSRIFFRESARTWDRY